MLFVVGGRDRRGAMLLDVHLGEHGGDGERSGGDGRQYFKT
jgi:hypothetical protein